MVGPGAHGFDGALRSMVAGQGEGAGVLFDARTVATVTKSIS